MSSTSSTAAPIDYSPEELAASVVITIVSIVAFLVCCCAPCIVVGIYCFCVARRQNEQNRLQQQQPTMMNNNNRPINNNVHTGTVVEMAPPSIYNNEYHPSASQRQGDAPVEPHWAQPPSNNPGYHPGAPITNSWFASDDPVRPTESQHREDNHHQSHHHHPAYFSHEGRWVCSLGGLIPLTRELGTVWVHVRGVGGVWCLKRNPLLLPRTILAPPTITI